MDEQINSVIEKLAEKAGVAVEAAQPIAETVVRETALRGSVCCLFAGAAVVTALVLFCVSLSEIRRAGAAEDDDRLMAAIAAAVAAGGAALLLIGVAADCLNPGLSDWLAPTRSVLEAVLAK